MLFEHDVRFKRKKCEGFFHFIAKHSTKLYHFNIHPSYFIDSLQNIKIRGITVLIWPDLSVK